MLTAGNETDFQAIEDDRLELSWRFRIVRAGYDPRQSTRLTQRLRAGRRDGGVRSISANFSPAIIGLDAATRSDRLQHDGNPVLERCIGNVVGGPDRWGKLYPTKACLEQKSDAAALSQCHYGD